MRERVNIHLGLNGDLPTDTTIGKFTSVGMIRSEAVCRKVGAYITDPSCQSTMISYLREITNLFQGKQVWYRLIEMETGEINILKGCDYSVKEKTQMLGLRGLRRGLTFPNTLEVELSVLAEVYQSHPNLGILLPYVTNSEEVEKFLELLNKNGLDRIQLGCMLEIPSICYQIKSLIRLGITYFVLGLNDLTSLILGSSRSVNTYNQGNEAVWEFISELVVRVKSFNQTLSIGGYLEAEHLAKASLLGIEDAIIHYHFLGQTLGGHWRYCPGQISQEDFKKQILLRQKFIEDANRAPCLS